VDTRDGTGDVRVDAIHRDACPACGAQATWDPPKRALVCPYCGTEAPGEIDSRGRVREIDLATALRELPDEARGWMAQKRSVRCRSCRAVSVFDPERVAQRCEFCGSPELVEYEEIRSPLRPLGVLPFRVGEGPARESLKRWFGRKWLAPGSLERRGLIDTVRGVYLPYWTFDAEAHARWSADSGTYYFVTETYRDANGRTRQRQARRVRWRPASGRITHVFDDELVPASTGVDAGLLSRIEPFPTGDLVPYDTAYLAGFVVEHYQVVLIDAARQSREQMLDGLRVLAARRVPGDTYRNLRVDAEFSGETFKLVLVPVWLLAYDFRRTRYQALVNGYTGIVAGEYPKSAWKIAVIVIAVAIVVMAVVIVSRG
jgi:hypothetical protein